MRQNTVTDLLNQVFEISKKSKHLSIDKFDRNIERILWLLEQEGYVYKDPTGEEYNETRMDCQATILKEEEPYIISETIKPIVFENKEGIFTIIQQARVVIK
jgi:hypothetical protein